MHSALGSGKDSLEGMDPCLERMKSFLKWIQAINLMRIFPGNPAIRFFCVWIAGVLYQESWQEQIGIIS